jgi:hypothetical protein
MAGLTSNMELAMPKAVKNVSRPPPQSINPLDPDPAWQQLRTVVRQFLDEARLGVRVGELPSKKEGDND